MKIMLKYLQAVQKGKVFAIEQKIRELKARISKTNTQKLKISPQKIIQTSDFNIKHELGKKQ